MNPIVIELLHSGLPNRRRDLTTEEVAQFTHIYQGLPIAAVGGSLCWLCQPAPAYQVVLSSGQSGLFLVSDGMAVRGASEPAGTLETRADPGGQLRTFLATLNAKLSAAEAAPATSNRCTGKPVPLDPPVEPCSCGVPGDFVDWTGEATLINNNCYNFARKDLWCRGGGRSPAAAPGNGNLPDWIACLAQEGLINVTDWNTFPPHANLATGWHVALALKPNGQFHFLRLDRTQQRWAHKFATLACQTCDGLGLAISMDGIRDANLCGYCVKLFFWAEPETV